MAVAWENTRSTDALLVRTGLRVVLFSLVYQTENVEVIDGTNRSYS
jgi:hypothetical protein